MPDSTPADPTAVLVCSDLAKRGLDLDALTAELSHRVPTACIRVVESLCEHPGSAVKALRDTGATRAVLATCRREIPETELRARARREGYGPYDLLVVPAPTGKGIAAAATRIAAALARLAGTPAGEPSRPRVLGSLSRSALLHLSPALTLEPVADIEADRCTGFARCGLCAAVCPVAAIAATGIPAEVTANACDACGLCVSACPTNAIHLAGATHEQIEAQLATLLAGAPHPALLFACKRANRADFEPWEVVELPALAAVTPGWILQAFAAGADRIHLLTCESTCCAPWREDGDRLNLCRRLLPPLLAERLSSGETAPVSSRSTSTLPAADVEFALAEPAATVRGIDALGVEIRLRDAASPLGTVELVGECTLCGACAAACPTGALKLCEDGTEATLRFEPARCTGCTLCTRVCPENVLRVEPVTDSAKLGCSEPLATAPRRLCRSCATPLLPQPLLERNRRLLGAPLVPEPDAELCADCRLLPRAAARLTRETSAGIPR